MASEPDRITSEGITRSEEPHTDSRIDWGEAFQSPEFLSGLQTALAHTLSQFHTPSSSTASEVDHLQQPGNPSHQSNLRHTTTTTQSSAPQVRATTEPLRHNPGTFSASSFVAINASDSVPYVLPAPTVAAAVTLSSNNGHQDYPTLGPEKAFVLGPGRAPIPAKLTKQIISLQFVEMVELIPENLEEPNSQSTTFAIEGTTIVPKSIPRKNKDVPDILTWVECFNSYTAVLTTFFPTRSRDLLAYMALIIRTAKRFGGM